MSCSLDFTSTFPYPRHSVQSLYSRSHCVPADPANTVTERLNTLLKNSGSTYVLKLCPNQRYFLQSPLIFSSPLQEISTLGYPTGDDRAVLIVNGSIADGKGHTTAVDGMCSKCSGVKLRNIQVRAGMSYSIRHSKSERYFCLEDRRITPRCTIYAGWG